MSSYTYTLVVVDVDIEPVVYTPSVAEVETVVDVVARRGRWYWS